MALPLTFFPLPTDETSDLATLPRSRHWAKHRSAAPALATDALFPSIRGDDVGAALSVGIRSRPAGVTR